jgi:hypothetical protein
LDERIAEQAKELVQSVDTVPVDMPMALTKLLQSAEQVSSLDVTVEEDLFPEDWTQQQKLDMTRTGVAYLDSFLGGGHVRGEIYGILGPYGSCKTTIAAMLIAEAAKIAARIMARDTDDPIPLAFLVSYEERTASLRSRLLGYAAQIHRRSIENLKPDMSNLSRRKSMRDYERRIFREELQAGTKVMGELGRARRAVEYLNQFVIPLDMTGFGNSRGRGAGYTSEIAKMISAALRKRKKQWGRNVCCGPVVIDYVGAMTKRYMAANEIPTSEMRHYISGAVLKAKSDICDVYNAYVWMMHQLSGEANARGTVARQDHTDAAEAKNFAENLDFAFCMGRPNGDNMLTMSNTKHRRRPPQEDMVLQIDGNLYQAVSTDGRYVIDHRRKKIVAADELSRLPGNPHLPPGRTGGSAADLGR